MDGGVSDNLGIRNVMETIEAMGGIREVIKERKMTDGTKLVFIIVDAQTREGKRWRLLDEIPGLGALRSYSAPSPSWLHLQAHPGNFAIELENRYKGMRSPHKLKAAVSGCTRECAEVMCKDFGLIATEKGYNLYVCGNGGMKPRHAELLAGDLDTDTLLRYIDRFLMFYVRTADRLQRTSVWRDNMEGGLDYLKDVVINDSLGIADELEADMAHVVSTYQCEWKSTLDDPEKLKRFRHFVDSDKADDNVVFVPERGQVRPATDAEKKGRIETVAV